MQRAIRGVGHCDFTAFELVTAFVDLVAWVEAGVRPAGDDVTNPAAVAAADVGCAFTNNPDNQHLLAALALSAEPGEPLRSDRWLTVSIPKT